MTPWVQAEKFILSLNLPASLLCSGIFLWSGYDFVIFQDWVRTLNKTRYNRVLCHYLEKSLEVHSQP